VSKANPAQHFTEQKGFLAKVGQRLPALRSLGEAGTFFCFFSLVKQRKEGNHAIASAKAGFALSVISTGSASWRMSGEISNFDHSFVHLYLRSLHAPAYRRT